MAIRRRSFLKSLPASVALAMGAGALSSTEAKEELSDDKNPCLDYGLSFVCNKGPSNAVRLWIESRTIITDLANNISQVFYQCGSCKSENTFAEKDLFKTDNYDFLPILGNQEWLVFRRTAHVSPSYRLVQPEIINPTVWGEPDLKLRYAKQVSELKSFPEIRDATAQGKPIVAQTELHHAENGLKAVIEYPVKTMNIGLENSMYQTDTGPVAYPDLSKKFERPIDCLSLAFVAFNTPDFADFLIEQPTPGEPDEKGQPQSYHYSQPFSLKSQNRLFASELP
tara:strand:+ start:4035 stop:4880 length:846 start_codon:yes stop_codon:yes gene_type:complete